jgi:Fur family iron response transcriptional regulator
MRHGVVDLLKAHGVAPSAQRLAVADYVLATTEHPSADQVFTRVSATLPMLSRATVYNTLNLFVARGLLRELVLAEGRVVFDPNLQPHHHFIDDETGEISDIPWHQLSVAGIEGLDRCVVREHMVVLRGRRRRSGC